MKSLIKRPGAWIPLVISATALAFILAYLTFFGNVHHEDEGTPARLFQILMTTQVFIIMFFAAKWLPKKPKHAVKILVLQVIAALIPIATIIILES